MCGHNHTQHQVSQPDVSLIPQNSYVRPLIQIIGEIFLKCMCTEKVTAFAAHSLLSLELTLNYGLKIELFGELSCGLGDPLTIKSESYFIQFQESVELFHYSFGYCLKYGVCSYVFKTTPVNAPHPAPGGLHCILYPSCSLIYSVI